MDNFIKIKIYNVNDLAWPLLAILLAAALFWNLGGSVSYGYIWAPVLWGLFSVYLLHNFIVSMDITIDREGRRIKVSGRVIKMSDISSVEKRKIMEYVDLPSMRMERICFVLRGEKNICVPCRFMPSTIDKNDNILAQLKKELKK